MGWVGRCLGAPEIASNLGWSSKKRSRPVIERLHLRLRQLSQSRLRAALYCVTAAVFLLTATFTQQAQATTCLATDIFTSACLDQADTFPLGNRIPLILIHGWNEQETVWDSLISNAGTSLQSQYKIYRFSYQSNVWSLPNLGQALRIVLDLESFNDPQFGSQKISFVAHSMGGLIARYFMSETTFLQQGPFVGLKGGERVLKLITLATPHHGSPLANGPVRNARAGAYWGSQLIASDLPIVGLTPYNEVNRNDLWWDNYDDLWNGSYGLWGNVACPLGCPDTQNSELQLINNDTAYDKKIIAYAGYISQQDVDLACSVGDNLACDFAGTGLVPGTTVILGGVFLYTNDGIVPTTSAVFSGHAIGGTHYFGGYDHNDLVCGIDSLDCSQSSTDTKVFHQIVSDLAINPPPSTSDLIPKSISLSSSSFSPGASLTANWTLANVGNAAANSTSTTVVRINQSPTKAAGTNLKSVPTAALAAQSSVPQSATVAAPGVPGTYYVWVIADDLSQVTNQVDTSNDLQPSASFTVTGPSPDLVPTGITPSAMIVAANATFSVSCNRPIAGMQRLIRRARPWSALIRIRIPRRQS